MTIATEAEQAEASRWGAKMIAEARAATARYVPPGTPGEVFWLNVGVALVSAILAAARDDEAVDRLFLIVGFGVALGSFASQHAHLPGFARGVEEALDKGLALGRSRDAQDRAPRGRA